MFSEFHGTKSQLHHAGFILFYLTTCPLKQEGTQIRTEETLITKAEKKKTLESFYTAQIQILETNPTRICSLSIY